MKCHAALPPNSLPGSLQIETFAVSAGRRCEITQTGTHLHRVQVTNYGTVPYQVKIIGECETSDIQYSGGDSTWAPKLLTVPPRPGRSGKTELSREEQVIANTPGRSSTIRTDLTFGAVGSPRMPRTLVFQVDTV